MFFLICPLMLPGVSHTVRIPKLGTEFGTEQEEGRSGVVWQSHASIRSRRAYCTAQDRCGGTLPAWTSPMGAPRRHEDCLCRLDRHKHGRSQSQGSILKTQQTAHTSCAWACWLCPVCALACCAQDLEPISACRRDTVAPLLQLVH